MKRTMLALAVLVALVAVIALRFWPNADSRSGMAREGEDAGSTTETGAIPGQVRPAAGSGQSGPSSGSHSVAPIKRDPALFLAPREVDSLRRFPMPEPLDLPPPMERKVAGLLDARTPEDAVWLDQHGYPSEAEWSDLDHTSEEELAAKAAEGDITSMALLGEKQFREGKISEGYDNLDEAAMLGSVWAVLKLGDAQKRARNIDNAFALYNLAALLGDWQSPSFHMQTGMGTSMSVAFFAVVPRTTAQLFANMQRARQLRGLPPIMPAQRPHVFNMPSGSDPIGVYPRRR